MKLYWRIESFPEFDHLATSERLMLFGGQRLGYFYLRNMVVAGILGGIVSMLWLDLVFKVIGAVLGGAVAVASLFGLWCLCTAVVYQWQMLRLRVRIRLTIMEMSTGEKVPACLACGFDLRASEGDLCPECGANVVVPAERDDG
ncbi:hypothetical protein [Poriferisphaera sp. WC338]|uniref:hypothetical protein n=1 Tax=Poriferisphaera sp. WC338 TaxID=3425129 RepID=UPI003D81A09C